MTLHGSPMLPPSFGNLPNYSGDASMVTLSIPSTHGRTSNGRSKGNSLQPTPIRRPAAASVASSKRDTFPDYINDFFTLILEIEDMSDKDKLFFFMDGLKEWARVELESWNVQDLDAAITAVDSYRPHQGQGKD
ncbi:hypothetical protein Dsin_017140 [Dipteronia sinensis]|uniref:Uncharacterized protein n=1 Tax=Dipteronia sinensis TaxID=43782 RepID=A0AAE0E697_9ROSI|nr:hypothetical protein Dsin_017140 [Dipteronia sinensis]